MSFLASKVSSDPLRSLFFVNFFFLSLSGELETCAKAGFGPSSSSVAVTCLVFGIFISLESLVAFRRLLSLGDGGEGARGGSGDSSSSDEGGFEFSESRCSSNCPRSSGGGSWIMPTFFCSS